MRNRNKRLSLPGNFLMYGSEIPMAKKIEEMRSNLDWQEPTHSTKQGGWAKQEWQRHCVSLGGGNLEPDPEQIITGPRVGGQFGLKPEKIMHSSPISILGKANRGWDKPKMCQVLKSMANESIWPRSISWDCPFLTLCLSEPPTTFPHHLCSARSNCIY